MHGSIKEFVCQVKKELPVDFRYGRILEFGSYDVNGSVRPLFEDPKLYIGVDFRPGPSVDVVSLCHEYNTGQEFDVFICTEMFEHDPFWRRSLQNGYDHLRVGGVMVLTFATTGRPEHNEEATPEEGYYENVTKEDFWEYIERLSFAKKGDSADLETTGIHFWGIKAK